MPEKNARVDLFDGISLGIAIVASLCAGLAAGLSTKSFSVGFLVSAAVLLCIITIWCVVEKAIEIILNSITANQPNSATTRTDFDALLKDIPKRNWVAISPDGTKVLAHGPNFLEVYQSAPKGTFIINTSP